MHQKYIDLFKEIAHATEVLAGQVVNFNHEKQDEKGEQTAKTMQNDYQQLYNKITSEQFDPETLNRTDYARLLVGTLIVINNIENRILNEQKAVKGYKDNIVAKLEQIVNECSTDEAAQQRARELFTIEAETEN